MVTRVRFLMAMALCLAALILSGGGVRSAVAMGGLADVEHGTISLPAQMLPIDIYSQITCPTSAGVRMQENIINQTSPSPSVVKLPSWQVRGSEQQHDDASYFGASPHQEHLLSICRPHTTYFLYTLCRLRI